MKLVLSEVTKSFLQGSNRLEILKNLGLSVASGEVSAVIGESGSGKSTLLALLAGFIKPDSGDLRWDNSSTLKWSENEWAHFRKTHLGFVFQSYHLIPYLNAVENVALPLRLIGHPDPEAKALAALEALGMAPRAHHYSSELSGGECQRVAIARALIHQPALLLADEPTGSLDQKTGTQVLDLLFRELGERRQTALVVTHSREVAARCHKVYELRDGQLWLQST